MTLIEVMFALGIFSLLALGILRAFLQTRRLTEGSVYQSTAQTIAIGYMEQLKTTSINSIRNSSSGVANLGTSFPILASFDNLTNDNLWTSTGTPPTFSSSPMGITVSGTYYAPGVTPSGAGFVDNLRSFDMSTSTTTTTVLGTAAFTNGSSPSNWTTIWPGANSTYLAAMDSNAVAVGGTPAGPPYDYSTRHPDNNDLHLNIWVWVEDLSIAGTASNVYRITLIYTYQFVDGGRTSDTAPRLTHWWIREYGRRDIFRNQKGEL